MKAKFTTDYKHMGWVDRLDGYNTEAEGIQVPKFAKVCKWGGRDTEGRAAGFCEVSVWLLTAPWWSLLVISKCFTTYAFISGFPDACHLQDHVWSLISCLMKETWNMGQKSSAINALFFKCSVLSPVWKKKKKKCSIFIVCLLAMNHYYLESDFIYCELLRDDFFFNSESLWTVLFPGHCHDNTLWVYF